jgi:hypothetical protein
MTSDISMNRFSVVLLLLCRSLSDTFSFILFCRMGTCSTSIDFSRMFSPFNDSNSAWVLILSYSVFFFFLVPSTLQSSLEKNPEKTILYHHIYYCWLHSIHKFIRIRTISSISWANIIYVFVLEVQVFLLSLSASTMKFTSILLCIMIFSTTCTEAGLVAWGICEAGCAAVVGACYAAAGAVFGTVTVGFGTPAAIFACNAAFGKCSAACALVTLLPTP